MSLALPECRRLWAYGMPRDDFAETRKVTRTKVLDKSAPSVLSEAIGVFVCFDLFDEDGILPYSLYFTWCEFANKCLGMDTIREMTVRKINNVWRAYHYLTLNRRVLF